MDDVDLPNDITDGVWWYEDAPTLPNDDDDTTPTADVLDWLYEIEGGAA